MSTTRDQLILEQSYRSNRKMRTLEDLQNISLDSPTRFVRCVVDEHQLGDGTIKDDKLIKAWILFNGLSSEGDPAVWGPDLNTFVKRFKWKLYTTLVKFGVI